MIFIGIGFFAVSYYKATTMKAVIIEVEESALAVKSDKNGLLTVGFTDKGNIGFKEGQEILIHYDGVILTSWPGQVGKVYDIKIINEKSDIPVSDDEIRVLCNSFDRVEVTVNELNHKGMTITIVDTNKLPYEYTTQYLISKKVKNEAYNPNPSDPSLRNRNRIYLGRSRKNLKYRK